MIDYRPIALGLATVGLAACVQPQASSREADLAAIAEARNELIAGLETDDVDRILAGLTADHLTMAPNSPALADAQSLTAWHQARIDAYTFGTTFSSEDIRLAGDFAVERWSATTRLTPRAGGADYEDQNKGLWVWQREDDGTWKLLWSIWNSDNGIEPTP
jgi:ketosteroid isomerase-like protein